MGFDLESLTRAGFNKTMTTAQWHQRNDDLDELGMNNGGPYVSNYVLTKPAESGGEVTVTVEQNTTTENQAGMEVTIKHPEIAVIEGPGGRAACPADDIRQILRLTVQLAKARQEG